MYFEVVTKRSGTATHYHARIRGGNNETIFSSQIYYAKQSAIHACEVVKGNAKGAEIREVTE
jgi:uncharacterized protein YegP (UPF0339 family)